MCGDVIKQFMKEILLTKGRVAFIDDNDFERVSQFRWHFHNGGYAVRGQRKIRPSNIYMHRFIMNAPKDITVDHISGNKLDNRKSNLRLVTQLENNWNRHDNPRGTFLDKHSKLWVARIRINYKRKIVGYFKTEADAHQAYLNAKQERDMVWACTKQARMVLARKGCLTIGKDI